MKKIAVSAVGFNFFTACFYILAVSELLFSRFFVYLGNHYFKLFFCLNSRIVFGQSVNGLVILMLKIIFLGFRFGFCKFKRDYIAVGIDFKNCITVAEELIGAYLPLGNCIPFNRPYRAFIYSAEFPSRERVYS